jgi:hypothetical protein
VVARTASIEAGGGREAHMTEACPKCWNIYPAPTVGAASVTCGKCGYVNLLGGRDERDILAIGIAIAALRDIARWKGDEPPVDYGNTGNCDDNARYASDAESWRLGSIAEEALKAITATLLN